MALITYTGQGDLDMPTRGITWHPGDTHDLPDELAAELDGDPRAPFAGARKKAAREARAAAEVAALQQEIAAVEAAAGQPADAVQEGASQ